MPLTEQEANDLVAEIVPVAMTERGQKAFPLAYEEIRESNATLLKFAAFLAMEDTVAKATELAVRAVIGIEQHIGLVAKLRMLMPGVTIAPSLLAAPPNTPIAVGSHQAMFTSDGLMDARWFRLLGPLLSRVGSVVDRGGKRRGTAFLVGSRHVLTAAHVVWDDVDLGVTPPRARDGSELYVEFREEGIFDPLRPPRVVKAIGGWLLASSPPCGTPPTFDIADNADAAANLDFALVEVDEPIGDEFKVLDVTAAPPAPVVNDQIAVCGYPGGNALSVGIRGLRQHVASTGRLHHMVDTAPGMSGSPCITLDGRAIGVHEGSVKEQKTGTLLYNRSVYLGRFQKELIEALEKAERTAKQRPGTPAPPMAAAPTTGEAASTPRYRMLRWLTEGASEEPLRIASALPVGITTTWRRHPVFGREKFQQWVLDASRADAPTRVAVVGGPDGAGKTFSVRLLHAMLNPEHDALCVIPPEVARAATAPEVFRRMGDVVLAPSTNGTGTTTVVRPEAGLLRHDVIPDGLDWLQRTLADAATQQVERRLWLAVDFGRGDEAWVASSTFWAELMTQAVRRSWMRLVIIGSVPSRFADFRTLLQVPAPPFEEDLQPVAEDAVVDFIGQEVGSRMAPAELTTLLDGFRATLRRITGAARPDAFTAAAAVCAMAIKEKLVRRGRDA